MFFQHFLALLITIPRQPCLNFCDHRIAIHWKVCDNLDFVMTHHHICQEIDHRALIYSIEPDNAYCVSFFHDGKGRELLHSRPLELTGSFANHTTTKHPEQQQDADGNAGVNVTLDFIQDAADVCGRAEITGQKDQESHATSDFQKSRCEVFRYFHFCFFLSLTDLLAVQPFNVSQIGNSSPDF